MKSGLEVGDTMLIKVRVTREMFAQFEGNIVHPVYSTVSMVYHMEWVSRQMILPYLEEDEEGMGAAVSMEHIAPCIEGSIIEIKATAEEVSNNKVLTKVETKNSTGLIGTGKVKQVILKKEKISRLISSTTV
ncbi:thioesterase [Bacillus spongiae]|uniref:Thioesterase n=1 Tax=Bacillus spongiae TaxID=2683610 RepID=A0ABU8HHZ2_9BACI